MKLTQIQLNQCAEAATCLAKGEPVEIKYPEEPWREFTADMEGFLSWINEGGVLFRPKLVPVELQRLRAALDALRITQRTVSGDFAGGYTILVTGHEMDAIRRVLAEETK